MKFTPVNEIKPTEEKKECVGCEKEVTTFQEDENPMCDKCSRAMFGEGLFVVS